jgi:hypothetical protein
MIFGERREIIFLKENDKLMAVEISQIELLRYQTQFQDLGKPDTRGEKDFRWTIFPLKSE